MSKWAISVKPSAVLELVDAEPQTMDDGATVQRFKTVNGIIYARRVEPTGLVKWFLQVEG